MRRFNLFILLTVLFISPYAFAQIPSCPCDTAELSNGNSGDEIVDILCPGGNLAAGNESIVTEEQVEIVRPGGEKLELGYDVFIGEGKACRIFEDTIGSANIGLTDEEYDNCRERLIQGCNLNSTIARDIPALSEWGMIAAAAGLMLVGVFFAVRKRLQASNEFDE